MTAPVERSWLARLAFPSPPRRLPGRRGIKICLRAVHVLAAGILVGGHAFGVAEAHLGTWVAGAMATGTLMLLLELHESGSFLLQGCGLTVVTKLVVLAGMPWYGRYTVFVLGGCFLVSVVSTHAPASFRHRLFLGRGRVEAVITKG